MKIINIYPENTTQEQLEALAIQSSRMLTEFAKELQNKQQQESA